MNNTFKLATKNTIGAVVTFGPLMSRMQAERKRKELAALTAHPVYVINTTAE